MKKCTSELPTTLLQTFCETVLNFEELHSHILDPATIYVGSVKRQWVNIFLLKKSSNMKGKFDSETVYFPKIRILLYFMRKTYLSKV